ncbi:Phenazine biosynthesis-like domain-containing [Argiope bruennichi]|uniref:Phenazine biosynthesis-like domain-containing n=1 Tax=Argiope bruennichi TaxID=94029 RepID=A0A8T0EG87_ARGBR|nr:Phenazine biosynthesis-like domain-containing [Argiope bruennichi]
MNQILKEFESFKTNPTELLSAVDGLIGVIVTLKASSEEWVDRDGNRYDFVSRYFAPWAGVPEDPVTGSAHNVLAPYWAKYLQKNKFYARQCSCRGGELHIEIQGDRVLLIGGAAVVVKGQIHV